MHFPFRSSTGPFFRDNSNTTIPIYFSTLPKPVALLLEVMGESCQMGETSDSATFLRGNLLSGSGWPTKEARKNTS